MQQTLHTSHPTINFNGVENLPNCDDGELDQVEYSLGANGMIIDTIDRGLEGGSGGGAPPMCIDPSSWSC